MIFQHTHQAVIEGRKTQTRRLVRPDDMISYGPSNVAVLSASGHLRWGLWNTYAVQPGRGRRALVRIRITGFRRGPVQAISDRDARAEGFGSVAEFAAAWNTIHRKAGARWEDNPEVWVLTFELVKGAG